ncbi:hypothetical protein B0J13DRAFT_624768 [Dactylonectria estremocensis]|uniref:Uncharacterized protein n=1 Tax=Dactylonectria estremocensis TaxID=1079267 RepID=A0A9P9ELE1_9HYPO|nr:hypothetical protein B0J13DRAFT_624768 [Dactylonectria estremocensis]
MEELQNAPFININAYPGVGNSQSLRSCVVSNHLLTDPVAAVFERTAEEYQTLRRALRKELLASLATSESTRDTAWTFPDQQSSSELGSSTAREYQTAAALRGPPFISIILSCELNENLKRAGSEDRGKGSNTKLTKLAILRSIRQQEDIFRFGNKAEMELDVTTLAPGEACWKVYEHIGALV